MKEEAIWVSSFDELQSELVPLIEKNDQQVFNHGYRIEIHLEIDDYDFGIPTGVLAVPEEAGKLTKKSFRQFIDEWFEEVYDSYYDNLVNGPACKSYIRFIIRVYDLNNRLIAEYYVDNNYNVDWFFVNVLEYGDLWN